MTTTRSNLKLFATIMLCAYFVLSVGFFIQPNVARAEEQTVIADGQLEQIEAMIFEVAEQDGYEFENITCFANDIFFANETWAGYLIDFIADGTSGYAIIFDVEGELQLVELIIGKQSPYYGKQGTYIYPSLGCYIIKAGGEYYDAETYLVTNYVADENDLFYAACGTKDKSAVPVTRSLNYIRGYRYYFDIPDFYDNYSTSLTSHSNNCANAAGLIMLNYWNAYYNNDLLKLDAALLHNGNIWFDNATGRDARKEYMSKFYEYMNTNWLFGSGGTLPGNLYSGFERLIVENGYKVSQTSVSTFEEMKESIINRIPVFITSTDYYFSTSSKLPAAIYPAGDHTLTIDYQRWYGIANSHTFVGYGYVFYTLHKTAFETYQESLIKVANGWGGSCYFNMTIGNVYSAAAINVYK